MNRFLLSILVVAAVLSTASMCDDDNKNTDSSAKDILKTSLGQGTWKVGYFFDKTDETANFAGYAFVFNADGAAIATKSSLSVPGSWDAENTSHGHPELYLDFGTTAPLEALNEDWIAVEYSALKITLEHESGGSGDTDKLILERN